MLHYAELLILYLLLCPRILFIKLYQLPVIILRAHFVKGKDNLILKAFKLPILNTRYKLNLYVKKIYY